MFVWRSLNLSLSFSYKEEHRIKRANFRSSLVNYFSFFSNEIQTLKGAVSHGSLAASYFPESTK